MVQIIEFFGLPACGKSTLENYIISETKGGEVTYGNMSDLTNEFRKTSAWYKLRIFPFHSFAILVLLFLKLPKLAKKDWRIYRGFVLLMLAYNYAKHTCVKDYVLIDHGIIQSIVSLLYGKEYDITYSKDLVKKLIVSTGINYLVYCEISPDESVKRMRLRNRTNSGRLDAIIDNPNLSVILSEQKLVFDILYSMFKVDGRYKVLSVLMDQSLISEMKQVLHLFEKNQ